jgi:hypothetical protein
MGLPIVWYFGRWIEYLSGHGWGRRLNGKVPLGFELCECEVCKARIRYETGQTRQPWAVLYRAAKLERDRIERLRRW